MKKCKHSLTSPSKYGDIYIRFCSRCSLTKFSTTEDGKYEFISKRSLKRLNSKQLASLISLPKIHSDNIEINKYIAEILTASDCVLDTIPAMNREIVRLADQCVLVLKQFATYENSVTRLNAKWLEMEQRIMRLERIGRYTND